MDDKKRTADVVIIGGGIMGLCTAYYLAKRGASDVVLLERDLLAQATTGLSVGGIRQQFSHPANILLSQQTLKVFENFEEEFGVDNEFRQAGYLFLAQKEDTWNDILAGVETQQRFNVPVEVLCAEEVKRRWPYINVDDLKGGTFCSLDGYADPYLTAMGFARRARQLGVRIEEKTEVTGIMAEKGKVEGVLTTRDRICSPRVVNTAGPWGARVAGMAGLDLPVRPCRRQVFATRPFALIPRPVPMVIDQDLTFYFRGEDPSLLMGMSDPDEPFSFNTRVDRSFMEKVVETAIQRAPALAEAQFLRGWAGLYAITPDDNAIIGEAPGIRGFFCALGFSGHGFQHGPAAGLILSQLILEGFTDFDIMPFAFDRFDKIEKGERRVV